MPVVMPSGSASGASAFEVNLLSSVILSNIHGSHEHPSAGANTEIMYTAIRNWTRAEHSRNILGHIRHIPPYGKHGTRSLRGISHDLCLNYRFKSVPISEYTDVVNSSDELF